MLEMQFTEKEPWFELKTSSVLIHTHIHTLRLHGSVGKVTANYRRDRDTILVFRYFLVKLQAIPAVRIRICLQSCDIEFHSVTWLLRRFRSHISLPYLGLDGGSLFVRSCHTTQRDVTQTTALCTIGLFCTTSQLAVGYPTFIWRFYEVKEDSFM